MGESEGFSAAISEILALGTGTAVTQLQFNSLSTERVFNMPNSRFEGVDCF